MRVCSEQSERQGPGAAAIGLFAVSGDCLVTQGGCTALHVAASKDWPDIAQLLLSVGAAVDAETNVSAHWAWLSAVVLIAWRWAAQEGITALRCAAETKSLTMCKLLLEARAAVDSKTKVRAGYK